MPLFAWPTLADAVALSVDRIELDGVERTLSETEVARRQVDIADRGDWVECALQVSIDDPSADLAKSGYSKEPTITVGLRCRRTNSCWTTVLSRIENHYAGDLRFPRADVRGRATLAGDLTIEVEGAPFRIVGLTDEWTIDVDAVEPLDTGKNQPINIRFASFSTVGEPESEFLGRRLNAEYYLRLEGGDATLFINEDREEFVQLLRRPRVTGAARRAREVMVASMYHDVFLAIAVAAIHKVQDATDEGEYPELPASTIYEAVLKLLARSSEGVQSVEELLEQIVRADGDFDRLVEDVTAVLARVLKLDDSLRDLSQEALVLMAGGA